jgi:hypothetical protein
MMSFSVIFGMDMAKCHAMVPPQSCPTMTALSSPSANEFCHILDVQGHASPPCRGPLLRRYQRTAGISVIRPRRESCLPADRFSAVDPLTFLSRGRTMLIKYERNVPPILPPIDSRRARAQVASRKEVASPTRLRATQRKHSPVGFAPTHRPASQTLDTKEVKAPRTELIYELLRESAFT